MGVKHELSSILFVPVVLLKFKTKTVEHLFECFYKTLQKLGTTIHMYPQAYDS